MSEPTSQPSNGVLAGLRTTLEQVAADRWDGANVLPQDSQYLKGQAELIADATHTWDQDVDVFAGQIAQSIRARTGLPEGQPDVWAKAAQAKTAQEAVDAFFPYPEKDTATPPCEHPAEELTLMEDGYTRRWGTTIAAEEKTIHATFHGSEDWGDEGEGEYLYCNECGAHLPVPDDYEIIWD